MTSTVASTATDRRTGDGCLGHRPRDPGPRRRRSQPGLCLAEFNAQVRMLRIADAPDEALEMSLAWRDLKRYAPTTNSKENS